MLSLLKRYRELLVVSVLLVVPFVHFLTRGQKGREPNVLDRAVLSIASPLAGALTWIIDGTGALWAGYVSLRGVRAENATLRDENGRLTGEVHALEEARAENERLRRLLQYQEQLGAAPITARVVGVNPDPNNPSVRINRGEQDGVVRGMAVVTPDGVVGQIQRTVAHAADVLLLTDPKSKVGVRVQRTRARGLAAVDGPDRTLRLEYALRSEQLEEGDLVITSGTDGVYPAGLVVGRLTRIDRKGQGAFQQAEILPAVDTTKLEELVVVPSNAMLLPAGGAPPGGGAVTAPVVGP